MHLIDVIVKKIEDYSFAIYDYGMTREWNFNDQVEINGQKAGLFSTDFNSFINRFHPGKYELMFLCFHANKYNPTENNLFTVLLEIYDRLIHKGTQVLLVKYHYKPHIIQNLPLVGILKESVFRPAVVFNHDLLLVDADTAPANTGDLITTSILVKKILKQNIENLALCYFWEKLLEQEGLTQGYIAQICKEGKIKMNLITTTPDFFPVFLRSVHGRSCGGTMVKEGADYDTLLHQLKIDVHFRYVYQRYDLPVTSLVLSPLINEVYLKISQEYYVESEWPFISEDLMENIRTHNTFVYLGQNL